jgi:hypothetical protein
MPKKTDVFRVVPRPRGVSSQYALLIVDGCGMPHLPLTYFYSEMQEGFSDGTARTYLNVLLPYFTYVATDSWRQHRWDSEPEAVRASVRDYLLHKLHCKVRHQSLHEMVTLTVHSPSSVRVFLAALKHFYHLHVGPTGTRMLIPSSIRLLIWCKSSIFKNEQMEGSDHGCHR